MQDDDKARLYGQIDKLVKITVAGEEYEVPEALELLRCYQYLDFNIAFENFCWNGNCQNCEAPVSLEKGTEVEPTLCCQTSAVEGMVIQELPEGVEKP